MSFAVRPPSSAWEAVPLAAERPLPVWGWFKPPHAPNTVAVHVPDEIWQAPESAALLTIRRLALATGVEQLLGWTLYGQHFQLDDRTAAFLDAPLPRPPAGADSQIILWTPLVVAPVAQPMSPTMGGASGLAPGEDPGPLFDLIAYYWSSILQLESDLRRTRMQLEQGISRLLSLNRDLNTEEALAADSLDKKDWQEARRWLKDCAAPLSRSVKEIDVGIISGAGQRGRFEDLYRQHVIPRIPFPGLKQAAVDFEMHNKSVKNVLQAAQTALSKGSSDGERRANAVLQRLSGKVRQKRNKARGTNA
ncbi:MAG TPA: hypothetical protein VM165_23425 [Planctomycetaceae bacterium]|nr:hypothetical protein [Planctomycetaceae bacterium]